LYSLQESGTSSGERRAPTTSEISGSLASADRPARRPDDPATHGGKPRVPWAIVAELLRRVLRAPACRRHCAVARMAATVCALMLTRAGSYD
jgi:hypothetical protein